VGSGNPPDDDGRDHDFRQTGYEDNSSQWNGVSQVRYYGALLDPELSNLTVFTAGAGVRPVPQASIETLYHRYRQYYAVDETRGALIDPPARPNGIDPELGDALDVVLGVSELWGRVTAAWTFAWFFPGPAFAPREETAFLHRFELRVTI
jgi:alginate production protein